MKALKIVFPILLLFLFAEKIQAQELTMKGVSVHSYMGVYKENDEIKTYDVNEIYNISFADGILIHNILTDGIISNSQIYKITNVQRKVVDGLNSFTFNATSGISGSIYSYEVYFEKEGGVTLKLIQPDGSSSVFMASYAVLKTFIQ